MSESVDDLLELITKLQQENADLKHDKAQQKTAPVFPGKVWLMVWTAYARLTGQPLMHNLPNRRTDEQGNVWNVVVSGREIIVQKHVNRARSEAAEVEIGNIRQAWGDMTKRLQALTTELKRRKANKHTETEVQEIAEQVEAASKEVLHALERHETCRALVESSETYLYRFTVDDLDNLVFGDVPMRVEIGKGPQMEVPELRLPDGLIPERD